MTNLYLHERRMLSLVRLLERKPCSIGELADQYGVDKRTVRRWLETLERRGLRIVREGVFPTSPYRIMRNKRRRS